MNSDSAVQACEYEQAQWHCGARPRQRRGHPFLPSRAFGICSFWGAEYLALGGGSPEEAQSAFEALCGYANHVGLFAEEIDPASGQAVGNLSQAFTHVGLINAALSLSDRLKGKEPRDRELPRKEEAEARMTI